MVILCIIILLRGFKIFFRITFKNWDYIYRLLEPLAERWYKQKRKVESDPDDFEQHNKRLREIERGQ